MGEPLTPHPTTECNQTHFDVPSALVGMDVPSILEGILAAADSAPLLLPPVNADGEMSS